eukprot:UN0126
MTLSENQSPGPAGCNLVPAGLAANRPHASWRPQAVHSGDFGPLSVHSGDPIGPAMLCFSRQGQIPRPRTLAQGRGSD